MNEAPSVMNEAPSPWQEAASRVAAEEARAAAEAAEREYRAELMKAAYVMKSGSGGMCPKKGFFGSDE